MDALSTILTITSFIVGYIAHYLMSRGKRRHEDRIALIPYGTVEDHARRVA